MVATIVPFGSEAYFVTLLSMGKYNDLLLIIAASLGNVGPALGSLGPSFNYEHITGFAKIWCSFLMLVGRLELFTLLIIFSPYFWKNL